ncbi:DNA-directed RNA polymerase subunit omega [Peptoniphilus equinus]|uniref:DNA-directed RNA polymerase subunit omega n=1 Tax=Peptoniphilus equinus TaxID=3016343 RepID=A0ABY7QT56_9FIRM|nr:DNA-directed RNA polymerase subunit omega [Peptoniphilus equinus]WBW49259.1 DNA-directed RNA polymerase subunit omega [Peptoniphilus equinus]
MNIPSFKELKEITNSRYGLVILVSKRARKIVDGNTPLIDTKEEKPVSIAIDEATQGAITFGEPMSNKDYEEKIAAERQKRIEALRQERDERMIAASQMPWDTEDIISEA